MSYRSVAARKRTAAARLQERANVLLLEAAEFDRRADELQTQMQRPTVTGPGALR